MSDPRYAQQIAVDGFGAEAQERLRKSRALIIGAGGLGTPVATVLAAAGVGSITIIDGDKVETTNLHRQFHYRPSDVGKHKAQTLCARLSAQDPELEIQAIGHAFTEGDQHMVAAYDIVCDCTDNLAARITIDAACGRSGVPLIFAAVREWEGYLTVLHHHKKFGLSEAFDLKAFYADAVMNCAQTGIMSTTCMVLGGMQANEAVKVLVGLDDTLDGRLLCIELRRNVQRVFDLQKGKVKI